MNLVTPLRCKRILSHTSRHKGFTVIELLIVIAVIGVLAGVTLVAYSGIKSRAYVSNLKVDLSNSASALELAKIQKRQYPATMEGIDVKPSGANTFSYYVSDDSTKYCVSASHEGVDSYYITSNSTAPQQGVCDDFLTEVMPPPPDPPTPPTPPANCSAYTKGSTGPGGGIIVYAAATPQSWGCFVEAAKSGGWWCTTSAQTCNEPTYRWGCRNQNISTPQTGYGQGMQNTVNIVNGCSEYSAADKARSFRGGGFSDWYLPNRNEMDALMKYQDQLVIKNGSGWMAATYWTSNQYDSAMGLNYLTHGTACFIFCVTVNDGFTQEYKDNSALKYVRPVRSF